MDVAYLEDLVHNKRGSGWQNEVRVPYTEVREPQKAVVHHSRYRQLAHSSEASEGTETDNTLNDGETCHPAHPAVMRLHNGCLLHPVQVLLLLVTSSNGGVQLLLQRPSQWLQSSHSSHLVRAESLEDEHATAHDNSRCHDGSCPAPAGL